MQAMQLYDQFNVERLENASILDPEFGLQLSQFKFSEMAPATDLNGNPAWKECWCISSLASDSHSSKQEKQESTGYLQTYLNLELQPVRHS
eukprot:1421227-Amphidinium_carterae.1